MPPTCLPHPPTPGTPGAAAMCQRLVSPPLRPACSHRCAWGHSRAAGSCWTTDKGAALVLRDARGAVCRQRQETLAAGGPGTGQLGAQGQVAVVAELSSCLRAQGLGLEAQPGHAAIRRARLLEPLATCQENRTVPTVPSLLLREPADLALRDPRQLLVTGGNAHVGTRAKDGCSLPPRHDPQSPGQRPRGHRPILGRD